MTVITLLKPAGQTLKPLPYYNRTWSVIVSMPDYVQPTIFDALDFDFSSVNQTSKLIGALSVDGVAYTEEDTLAECQATDESFYYDDDNQTLYGHAPRSVRLDSTDLSFSTVRGYSNNHVFYDSSNVKYLPYLQTDVSLGTSADRLEYEMMSFQSNSIELDNSTGEFDVFIDTKTPGSDVKYSYMSEDDYYDGKTVLEPIYTGYSTADNITRDGSYTISVGDKREQLTANLPDEYFSSDDYSAEDWAITNQSIDGVTEVLYSVAMDNSNAIAVGENGIILVSDDYGYTWTEKDIGVTTLFRSVAISGSNAIAVGASGTVLVSDDYGYTWTEKSSGVTETLRSIAIVSSNAIAVGFNGTVLVSDDYGYTWTEKSSGVTETLYSVAISGVNAIAVGYSGSVIVSDDYGYTWTEKSSGVDIYLYSVAMSGSNAIAVGDSGTILVSDDYGYTWTEKSSGVTETLRSVFYIPNSPRALISGLGGSILTLTYTQEYDCSDIEDDVEDELIPDGYGSVLGAPAYITNGDAEYGSVMDTNGSLTGDVGPYDFSGVDDTSSVNLYIKLDDDDADSYSIDLSDSADTSAVTVAELVTAINAEQDDITASTSSSALNLVYSGDDSPSYIYVYGQAVVIAGIGEDVNYRFATVASLLNTVYVKDDDDEWESVTLPALSANGTFSLDASIARDSSGTPRDCKVDAVFRPYSNPGDIIKDLMYRGLSIDYSSINYDTTTFASESASLADVYLYMGEEMTIYEYIEVLQSSSTYGFRFWSNQDNKYSLMIDDNDRDVSHEYLAIKNIDDSLSCARDFTTYATTVTVTYNDDQTDGTSESYTDDTREADIYDTYGVYNDVSFSSGLTSLADAMEKADRIAEDYAIVRNSITFKIRGIELIDIYEIVTIDTSVYEKGVKIREYMGERTIKVMAVTYDFAAETTEITGYEV